MKARAARHYDVASTADRHVAAPLATDMHTATLGRFDCLHKDCKTCPPQLQLPIAVLRETETVFHFTPGRNMNKMQLHVRVLPLLRGSSRDTAEPSKRASAVQRAVTTRDAFACGPSHMRALVVHAQTTRTPCGPLRWIRDMYTELWLLATRDTNIAPSANELSPAISRIL